MCFSEVICIEKCLYIVSLICRACFLDLHQYLHLLWWEDQLDSTLSLFHSVAITIICCTFRHLSSNLNHSLPSVIILYQHPFHVSATKPSLIFCCPHLEER